MLLRIRIAYCEGGFYGGHLKIHDKIKPVLKSATASFGITALNEFQQLYNKKSLVEDGAFAIKTMEYINMKVNEFKKEDGYLYAIYGHRLRICVVCRYSSSVRNMESWKMYRTGRM